MVLKKYFFFTTILLLQLPLNISAQTFPGRYVDDKLAEEKDDPGVNWTITSKQLFKCEDREWVFGVMKSADIEETRFCNVVYSKSYKACVRSRSTKSKICLEKYESAQPARNPLKIKAEDAGRR